MLASKTFTRESRFTPFFGAPPFEVRSRTSEDWGVNTYEIVSDGRFLSSPSTNEWWKESRENRGKSVFRTALLPPRQFVLSTAALLEGGEERRSWSSVVSFLTSLPRILYRRNPRGTFDVFFGFFDVYFREMAKTHWKARWRPEDRVWRLGPGGVYADVFESALSAFSKRRSMFRIDEPTTRSGSFEMKKYQLRARSRIREWAENGMNGFLVAHDPGLGKTRTALSVAEGFLSADETARGAFVLAPPSTLSQWKEAAGDVGLVAAVVHGSEKNSFETLDEDVSIVATSPDYMLETPERMKKAVELCENRLVVLDEATRYKSSDSASSKAASFLALAGRFLLMLSGTPVENNIGELESLVLLGEPRVCPRDEFRAKHEIRGEREIYVPKLGKKITIPSVKYIGADEFGRRVAPFMDAERHDGDEASLLMPELEKEDIFIVPGRVENTVDSILREEYRKTYDEVFDEDEAFREAYRGNRTPGAAVLAHSQMAVFDPLTLFFVDTSSEILPGVLERLKNERVIPEGYVGAKAAEMLKLLGRNDVGSTPSVVFTSFSSVAKRAFEIISAGFPERPVFLVTGATPRKARLAVLSEASQSKNAIIVCTGALSMGVEMQFARTVVHLDIPWTPSQEDQRTDRIHRIGGKGKGRVFRLLCTGTIDTKKLGIHKKKRASANAALAASLPSKKKSRREVKELVGESFIF